MEYALNTGIKSVVEHFKDPRDGYNREMCFHIEKFVAFVRSEIKKGFDLLVEEKIQLPQVHASDAFGTVDVAIVEPFGTLHVIDLKYGRKDVSAEDNPQMIYYALGIATRLKFDLDNVVTTIYQPRSESKPVRSFKFSMDYLKEWEGIFKRAVTACELASPETDLNAGEHCFFCIANKSCPALKTKQKSRAESAFSIIT